MATYYRLSKTGDSLPKHWAYLDDFDLDGTDNRNDGFQAWESLPRVIYAAFGYDCDGTYDANEYSTFLVIEADEDCVSDGVGEWWAIENEGVEKVYSVPTAKLVEFVEDGWNNDDEYDEYELKGYLEDHEEEISAWLKQNAKSVEIEFVETLSEGSN